MPKPITDLSEVLNAISDLKSLIEKQKPVVDISGLTQSISDINATLKAQQVSLTNIEENFAKLVTDYQGSTKAIVETIQQLAQSQGMLSTVMERVVNTQDAISKAMHAISVNEQVINEVVKDSQKNSDAIAQFVTIVDYMKKLEQQFEQKG